MAWAAGLGAGVEHRVCFYLLGHATECGVYLGLGGSGEPVGGPGPERQHGYASPSAAAVARPECHLV